MTLRRFRQPVSMTAKFSSDFSEKAIHARARIIADRSRTEHDNTEHDNTVVALPPVSPLPMIERVARQLLAAKQSRGVSVGEWSVTPEVDRIRYRLDARALLEDLAAWQEREPRAFAETLRAVAEMPR